MSDKDEEVLKDEDGGVTIDFVDEDGGHLFSSHFDKDLWNAVQAMAKLEGVTPQEFVLGVLTKAGSEENTGSQD